MIRIRLLAQRVLKVLIFFSNNSTCVIVKKGSDIHTVTL